MKKENIEFHSDRYGYSKKNPAVNVKVYHYPRTSPIVDKFKCSEAAAEKALLYAFESAQTRFWEDAEEFIKEVFPSAKVYSEGRSSGWLTVHNLSDVETWDAIAVGKWSKVVKWCKEEINYLTSLDYVLEEIDANEWYKEGSELYNFIDTKDGKPQNIADMKQEAIKAGFGPVIKK